MDNIYYQKIILKFIKSKKNKIIEEEIFFGTKFETFQNCFYSIKNLIL